MQAIVADAIEERFDERATGRALDRLDIAYRMLDSQLAEHDFLAGATFTIASCAAAPGLFYACPGDSPSASGAPDQGLPLLDQCGTIYLSHAVVRVLVVEAFAG